MKKVLFISFVLQLLCASIAQAHPEDLIVLKSGRIVQGYISSQIPGKRITLMTAQNETPGFDISEVAIIEQAARDNELIVGLVDVIETNNRGTVKGQIIKRILGEKRSMVILTSDGTNEEILNANILTQKKEKLNKDFSLFSQAEFLDVVVTEDEEFTGIITKQDFTGDSPTLYLEKENGEGQTIKVSNVRELRRQPNKSYNPLTVFHPESGKIYFNKTVVDKVQTIKWKKDFTALDDKDIEAAQEIIAKDGKLTIDAKDTPDIRKSILLEVQQIPAGKVTRYAFSLLEAGKGGISYDTTRQDGTEAQWTYTLKEGLYVLLIPNSDLTYIVNIVK